MILDIYIYIYIYIYISLKFCFKFVFLKKFVGETFRPNQSITIGGKKSFPTVAAKGIPPNQAKFFVFYHE